MRDHKRQTRQDEGRANGERNGEPQLVKTGKADVKLDLPAHVPGVRMGNSVGNLEDEVGISPLEQGAVGNARRSTGINPQDREPIDPRMPNLSPP